MGRHDRKGSKRQTTLRHRQSKRSAGKIDLSSVILTKVGEKPGLFGIKSLFRELGLHQREYNEYRRTLYQLIDAGEVIKLGRRRLALPKKHEVVNGILRLTSHGYGFVDRKNDSIFISAREASKAFDGDLVEVAVTDTGHESGPEGFILSVDTESRKPLLAQLRGRGNNRYADIRSGQTFFTARVDEQDLASELKSGDLALVKVEGTRRRYPLPTCQIVQHFGNPDEKGIAEKALLGSFNMDLEYPREAVEEADKLHLIPARKGLRQDLKDEFVITIDPADAKDHDDAASLRRDDEGNYHLGVHIADLSRYVHKSSAIDKEAHSRGFSVYLQHQYLPMLPPRLPGELCSLKPGKDRLALSALLKISPEGKILHKKIVPSRVRINKLISYEKAQDYLDNKDSEDPELSSHLLEMRELAQVLNKRRLSEGGIDLDLPEMEFHWDGGAAPKGIFQQPRLQSHQLIEEFMLAANRAVAETWAEKFGGKAPSIFRVHEAPDGEKRQKLSDYLADAGFEWPAEKLVSANQLTRMLDEAKRRFPQEVTANIARKALMLARYDAKARGHFGLGFKKYLHFTSPIRRFADLTVHRLIWKHIIEGHPFDSKSEMGEKLEALCAELTEKERRIAELERESRKLSSLLYLQERNDETFPAYVVEAVKDKIFVVLKGLFIEGLLSEDSAVRFQSRRRTGKRLKRTKWQTQDLGIGDELEVEIAKIDILARKVEFRPV